MINFLILKNNIMDYVTKNTNAHGGIYETRSIKSSSVSTDYGLNYYGLKLDRNKEYSEYSYVCGNLPTWSNCYKSNIALYLFTDLVFLAGYYVYNGGGRMPDISGITDIGSEEELLDLSDCNLYAISGGSDRILFLDTIKDYNDLKSKLNYYDPNKNGQINALSSFKLIYNMLKDPEENSREIFMNYGNGYYGGNINNDINKFINNFDRFDIRFNKTNVNKIRNSIIRTVIFKIEDGLSNSIENRKDNILSFERFSLSKYSYFNYNTIATIRDALCTLDINKEEKYELVKEMINIAINSGNDYIKSSYSCLLKLFDAKVINDNYEYFFNLFTGSSKYDYEIRKFFKQYKDCKYKVNINKKKFLKLGSLKEYNDIMKIETDEVVINLADLLLSAPAQLLSHRVLIVFTFLNRYSLEELKIKDLKPITSAINDKLISRYEYELSSLDLNLLLLDGDKEKIEYVCDKIIEDMCNSSLNSISRIRLIKNNESSNKNRSIYYYLSKALDRSDNLKVLKGLAKMGI